MYFLQKRPWSSPTQGFTAITSLPLDSRERGPLPPSRKSECSVLLLIGMIGAGKTHYTTNKLITEPEKSWNVISTNELLKLMRVSLSCLRMKENKATQN